MNIEEEDIDIDIEQSENIMDEPRKGKNDIDMVEARKHIKPMDFSTIPLDSSVLCIGSRRSGKSTLSTYFLNEFVKSIPEQDRPNAIFLISSTNNPNDFKQIPNKFRYRKLEVLNDIMKQQEKIKKYNLKAIKHKLDKFADSRIIVILDDLVGGSEDSENERTAIRNSPLLKRIWVNGRHLTVKHNDKTLCSTMVLLLSQSCKAVGPLLRKNSDIIIVSSLVKSMTEKKVICEETAGLLGAREGYQLISNLGYESSYMYVAFLNHLQNIKNKYEYIKLIQSKELKESEMKFKLFDWRPEHDISDDEDDDFNQF